MCRQAHRGESRSETQCPAPPAARPPQEVERGPVRFKYRGPTNAREGISVGVLLCLLPWGRPRRRPPVPSSWPPGPFHQIGEPRIGAAFPRPRERGGFRGRLRSTRRDGARLAFCLVQALFSVRMAEDRRPDGLAGDFQGWEPPRSSGEPGEDSSELSWLVVEPELVASDAHLRPIERRMRRLVASGVDPAEVAWRFRRSQRSVAQILALGSRTHRGATPTPKPQVLRPLERRILTWRESGASYAEIGARFRHSPQFVRRVEDLAKAKLARAENEDPRHGESFPSAEPRSLSN